MLISRLAVSVVVACGFPGEWEDAMRQRASGAWSEDGIGGNLTIVLVVLFAKGHHQLKTLFSSLTFKEGIGWGSIPNRRTGPAIVIIRCQAFSMLNSFSISQILH